MGGQVIDAARVTTFVIEPERLTLITDPAHPLYDERIKLPLDESLVKNIMVYGVKIPVLVRKNGEAIEVVDGRQRVRAAIEANKRLEEAGNLPVKVKILVEKGSDPELFGICILTNELRRGDSVLTKARKAKRMLDLDADEDRCALAFGITKVQLGRWLKLLDLDPKVQKAVEAEEIGATAAAELAELSREKQVEELEKLKVEAGSGKKVNVGAAKRAVKATKGEMKYKKPSARMLQRLYEAPEGAIDEEDRTLIGWILGEVSSRTAGIEEILSDLDKGEKEAAEKKAAEKKAAKAAKKEEKARKAEEKKAAKAAAREAKKQKIEEKKAAAAEAKARKKEEREEAKRQKAENKAALKRALEEKKAEILAKQMKKGKG